MGKILNYIRQKVNRILPGGWSERKIERQRKSYLSQGKQSFPKDFLFFEDCRQNTVPHQQQGKHEPYHPGIDAQGKHQRRQRFLPPATLFQAKGNHHQRDTTVGGEHHVLDIVKLFPPKARIQNNHQQPDERQKPVLEHLL